MSGNLSAFEANPTGHFPQWGSLRAGTRDLKAHPLVVDPLIGRVRLETAASTSIPASSLVSQVLALEAQLNTMQLPYNPTPDVNPQFSVNSNTFVCSVLTRLNFVPPPTPPWTDGSTPGYTASINFR